MRFSFPIKRNEEHQKSEDMIVLALAVSHFQNRRGILKTSSVFFIFVFIPVCSGRRKTKKRKRLPSSRN